MRWLSAGPLIALACTLAEIRPAAASLYTDVPVPGGVARLAEALELPGLPERGRLIVELTRLLHDAEPGKNPASDRRLARLSSYFEAVSRERPTDAASPVSPPADTVALPLSPALWSGEILRRRVPPDGLLPALLLDRRAALLAHGLYALDDETLSYFADHPGLIEHLYDHAAGAFATFGEAIRIERGRVRVPGDALAEPLWQTAVGESPADPDRFVRALFDRREGHVAYLFHSLVHLGQARAAFALGLWIDDDAARRDRFRTLIDSLSAFPGLEFEQRPFSRPAEDIVVLLMRIRTEANGMPAPPRWRRLWKRAFETMDVPGDRRRLVRDIEEDGVIDAAWLSQMLAGVDFRFRAERLDQLSFGQRVFAAAPSSVQPDVIAALRAFPVTRMLMVALERSGVTAPAVYVAAARRAEELSSLDRNKATAALSQFQGAIGLVERLVLVRSLPRDSAERLIARLVDLAPVDGRYAGSIARWLRDDLAPAVGVERLDDRGWIDALSGRPPEPPVRVRWEDEAYRVDFSAPEQRRLTRALQTTNMITLARTFQLLGVVDLLTTPSRTLEDVRVAADRLSLLRADHPDPVSRAVQDLARITRPKDLSETANVGRSLLTIVDEDLAAALRALIYAVSDGTADDEATTRLASVSERHDFGLAAVRGEIRMRSPWAEPAESFGGGAPWHVTGSLLELDLGLSAQWLRSLAATGAPAVPVLSSTEARAFSRTVVLLNPRDLDASDLDGMLAAIARGRMRVASLAAAPADLRAMADEIRLDGWRRRLVEQTVSADPAHAASYFSMAELLVLGRPEPSIHLDAWGGASTDGDGCPCTRFVTPGLWSLAIGRAKTSILATQVADLNLRVAEHLHTLGLPGALLKDVMAVAAQDYVDHVAPLHANDWMTLVQSAQAFRMDRVADIVASLTAFGPLVPDRTAPDGRRGR